MSSGKLWLCCCFCGRLLWVVGIVGRYIDGVGCGVIMLFVLLVMLLHCGFVAVYFACDDCRDVLV